MQPTSVAQPIVEPAAVGAQVLTVAEAEAWAMELAHGIAASRGMPLQEALIHVHNSGLMLQPGTRLVQPHARLGVNVEQNSGAHVKPERSAAGSSGLPRNQPGSASAAGGSCKTESGAYEEDFNGDTVCIEDEAALQVMPCLSPDNIL